ncbi:uncharacterized protein LOC133821223 [Humulus lupulus]|uniref:uncharacterized protein LOC133821223 n=1 Tax=Humulus lupulus TaxID=3486 RepID=UPI002B406980|nr:uncharacterized protein LOC133821223 [Humulus lupulus]
MAGIRNYWMNIFMLPISAVHEIDRLCRSFLWGEKNNRSKFHCSSWSQVSLPKAMGGLGFKEGCLWNKVLLAKYLWALSSKQDVLWVKWIDGVYLKGKSIWDYHLKSDVSWYWRKICYLRESFFLARIWRLRLLMKEQVGFAKAVWSSITVPRHRFILWQAVVGHLLTRDNLARFHIEVGSVACPWVIWKNWLNGKPKSVMHRIYLSCLAASVYHIWCNRNMCYFSQVSYTPYSLVKMIKRTIKIRLQGRFSQKDLSKNCNLYDFVQLL